MEDIDGSACWDAVLCVVLVAAQLCGIMHQLTFEELQEVEQLSRMTGRKVLCGFVDLQQNSVKLSRVESLAEQVECDDRSTVVVGFSKEEEK